MKVAAFCTIILAGFVGVQGGGYILKGGVMDFKRPLDYMDSAVFAGKMAWSQKLDEEHKAGGLTNSERNVRHVQYVPTFFTDGQNGGHQSNVRSGGPLPQLRNNRGSFNQPLFYNSYHGSY